MAVGANRILRRTGLAALLLGLGLVSASADEWRTVSSLIGSSKYENGFERYDYVNPNAPKGGTLNSTVMGTFDSFNPFIPRGTPAAGFAELGGGLLYETLMSQALDEPGTSHPLIAEAFQYPDDYSSATYRIDPKARWHDGKPITAEDVVWSLQVLKTNSPMYNRYFHNVTEAVALSEREVQFKFDQKGNRELPHIMGDLAVLPKHWWEGTDASGKKRDITQPTLEPPLGSGAYKIESFKPGSEIVWSRVPDYWAANLPVNVGRQNFDRRRYVYFQDDNANWQAFTKGGYNDVRAENSARRWATEYNFPAFTAGDVKKQEFQQTAGEAMQGFVLNLRRPQFQDRRVREALTYAFDFESMNRTLFYGLYARTNSYFEGGPLASSGLPQGKELELLNALRDKVPPEVFTTPYTNPVNGNSEAVRNNLREAMRLLKEAGFEVRDRKLTDASGKPVAVEFLLSDPASERIALFYKPSLERLGITVSIRSVDDVQYQNRLRSFDFDIITDLWGQSLSPGNEQRDFWGSAAADRPGSRNTIGIKNPAVDALIEKVVFAKSREELVAATKALDRVLLWNYYVVPQWTYGKARTARWNRFSRPDKMPEYGISAFPTIWWWDAAKAARVGSRQ